MTSRRCRCNLRSNRIGWLTLPKETTTHQVNGGGANECVCRRVEEGKRERGKCDASKVRVNAPLVQVDAPQVQVDAPQVQVDAPQVQVDAPQVRVTRWTRSLKRMRSAPQAK